MSTAGQRRRKRRRETPFPPLFATHFGDDFFCRQLLHGFVSNPPSATLLRVFREFRPYPTPARFRALSLQSNFGKSVLLFRRLTLPRGETPGRLAKRDSAGWLALLARLRRAPMEQKDPSNKQIRSLEVQYGGKELSDALPRHMRASLWTRNSRQVHAFARNKLCRKRRGNILETTLYPKTKKKMTEGEKEEQTINYACNETIPRVIRIIYNESAQSGWPGDNHEWRCLK